MSASSGVMWEVCYHSYMNIVDQQPDDNSKFFPFAVMHVTALKLGSSPREYFSTK